LTDPRPELSVIVATRNRAARLERLLASLRRQTLPRSAFEVIVVDDASTDETPALLAQEADRDALALRVITRSKSGGPGNARNDALKIARGLLIAFTDDDCEPEPTWLEAGLRRHREQPAAVIQGRTDPHPSELGRAGPFFRTVSVQSLGPQYQTCNIFYPRDLLVLLGGFDPAFAATGEDTDLAWRAIASGAPTVFADDARVFHAVTSLGALGYLRSAGRWSDSVQLFERHPELRRRQLYRGVFWHGGHYLLCKAILATLLARWLPLVVVSWLRSPYLIVLARRVRKRGGGPLMAVYWLLFDVLELVAMLRASARHRTLVI
jgi:glycosyltransferase involved in cell wall biosynthesis